MMKMPGAIEAKNLLSFSSMGRNMITQRSRGSLE
jgi:hypothetical protein